MIDNFLEHEDGTGRAALGILARPEAYPGLPPLPRQTVVLRLLRFEGLGLYTVWIVARDAHECHARRVIWDRPGDYRPGLSAPTTFGADVLVARADVEDRLSQLARCVVAPFAPIAVAGIDGINFGIEYGTFWRAACLYWWSGAAAEWQGLQWWFDDTVDYLDAVLPRASVRS